MKEECEKFRHRSEARERVRVEKSISWFELFIGIVQRTKTLAPNVKQSNSQKSSFAVRALFNYPAVHTRTDSATSKIQLYLSQYNSRSIMRCDRRPVNTRQFPFNCSKNGFRTSLFSVWLYCRWCRFFRRYCCMCLNVFRSTSSTAIYWNAFEYCPRSPFS